MALARPFRGVRFPARVILWAVRRHSRFAVSLRDLERMLADRGVQVDHDRSTVGCSASRPRSNHGPAPTRTRGRSPALGTRWDPHARRRRVAVPPPRGRRGREDSGVPAQRHAGCGRRPPLLRLDPRARRRARAAPRRGRPTGQPRNPIGAPARDGRLPKPTRHLRGRWLNDWIGQGHRRNRRRTRPMPGFKGFATARRVLADIDAMSDAGEGPGARRGSGGRLRAARLRLPELRCRRLITARARRPPSDRSQRKKIPAPRKKACLKGPGCPEGIATTDLQDTSAGQTTGRGAPGRFEGVLRLPGTPAGSPSGEPEAVRPPYVPKRVEEHWTCPRT